MNEGILFTLTFHPHNLAVKNIILKNVFTLKRDNNIGNFPVRSRSAQINLMINLIPLNANARDATLLPFIPDADKITAPRQSISSTAPSLYI